MKIADNEVLTFLKSEFEKILSKSNTEELIACALPTNSENERIHFIIDVIQQIVEM